MKLGMRRLACLLAALMASALLGACAADSEAAQAAPPTPAADAGGPEGYHAAVFGGDGFLAAGTGGRLDRIGPDGEVVRLDTPTEELLRAVLYDGGRVLACGDNGTILYSTDGVGVHGAQVPAAVGHVTGLAEFGGRYYASAGGGRILVSEDGSVWESVQTDTGNDLIAIAANGELLLAVTAETDLLISRDGTSWELTNFNDQYEDYYDRRLFGGISGLGDILFVYGQMEDDPGEPYLMYTQAADVWFFKPFTGVNGGDLSEVMPLTIHGVGISGDQLIAVCDGGRLLTVTECITCNQLSDAYEDAVWSDIAMGGGMVLLVGEDFLFQLVDESEVRQYNIGGEQAMLDMQNGAAMVDVRTHEERAAGYIPGSLHIPLAELEESLPQMLPDRGQEIIFYCAAGGRAQTALEQALALGYEWVYNLGGLDDWPYHIEVDEDAA